MTDAPDAGGPTGSPTTALPAADAPRIAADAARLSALGRARIFPHAAGWLRLGLPGDAGWARLEAAAAATPG